MRPARTWPGWGIAGLAAVLLVAGCGTETKQRLLHVFFTGVDKTNAPPPGAVLLPQTNRLVSTVLSPSAAALHVHQPYGERKCDACHQSAQSERLRVNEPALCLECHPKLGERAKYVHAPVAAGQCSFCHEAHESTVAALLNRPVAELCAKCHPAAQLKLVKDHTNPGNADCVRCHDPHRGEQWNLVRTRS